ncbi:MAG: cytochrome c oxidase subunit 3, partial [Polyangiales bacterium]
MPDDALGRPYGVPVRREPVVPSGVLGMLMFVATEIMFFSGLISAFVIGKSNAIGGWPPPGQPRLPVEETALNTAALLASGVA